MYYNSIEQCSIKLPSILSIILLDIEPQCDHNTRNVNELLMAFEYIIRPIIVHFKL